jgi:hypothetical protein
MLRRSRIALMVHATTGLVGVETCAMHGHAAGDAHRAGRMATQRPTDPSREPFLSTMVTFRVDRVAAGLHADAADVVAVGARRVAGPRLVTRTGATVERQEPCRRTGEADRHP